MLILAAISAVHTESHAALLHVPDADMEPSQRSFILGEQRLPMHMVQEADTETGRVNMSRLVRCGKRYCRDHLRLDPDSDDSIRLGRCGPSDEHTLPRGHHGLFHDGSSECAVVFVLHVSPEHVGLARHPNHVGPLIPIDWRSLPPVGIVVPEAPASIITTGRLNGPLAGNPHWGCHTSWDLTSDARPRTRWASGSRLLTSGPRSCDPVNLQEAPLPALYDCQPRSCLILATLRRPSDFQTTLDPVDDSSMLWFAVR